MPHILIADNESLQRMLIREMLCTDPTFTFTETEDGFETLEAARREHPAMIILDIFVPRIDGLTTCRLLKADPALGAVPVILVTALDPISDDDRIWIARADRFLGKPIEEDVLRDVIHQGLGRARTTTEPVAIISQSLGTKD